jgi:hypothetical protein
MSDAPYSASGATAKLIERLVELALTGEQGPVIVIVASRKQCEMIFRRLQQTADEQDMRIKNMSSKMKTELNGMGIQFISLACSSPVNGVRGQVPRYALADNFLGLNAAVRRSTGYWELVMYLRHHFVEIQRF